MKKLTGGVQERPRRLFYKDLSTFVTSKDERFGRNLKGACLYQGGKLFVFSSNNTLHDLKPTFKPSNCSVSKL